MGRYAKEGGGGNFTPAPAGTHVARCIRLVDIGTHHGEFQGEPNVRNQIIVVWELPNETVEIGGEMKPVTVSKFYTNSLHEKAGLRRDLESWRARPFTKEELGRFDLEAVLGAACMLSIVHTDKGKAKVVGVSKVPRGMDVPEAFHPTDAFWIEEWDDDKYEALSDGFKKLIEESDEYKARSAPRYNGSAPTAPGGSLSDDIPF